MKKYIGLGDMSSVNCASVLNVIRNCSSISRKEISDMTGLSWGGMTKIVNKLFDGGYIEEAKEESACSVGRTPGRLHIVRDKNVVIGLDLNREGFEAYVMNLGKEVLQVYSKEVAFSGKQELLECIYGFIDEIVGDFGEKNILAMGIAMQGVLDVENGISVEFPHCPEWKNVPIRKLLEERYEMDVFVEHDPNCILYSRLIETESENMVLFRLDRSVGMAASVNGKILRGNGLLEVAHCVVIPGGKPCRCGKAGCLEAYVSSCMEKNNVNEKELQELIEPLALFVSNMIQVFHSDTVFLTGNLIKYKNLFEAAFRERLTFYCGNQLPQLSFTEEGTLAVQGAALIAIQGAVDNLKI